MPLAAEASPESGGAPPTTEGEVVGEAVGEVVPPLLLLLPVGVMEFVAVGEPVPLPVGEDFGVEVPWEGEEEGVAVALGEAPKDKVLVEDRDRPTLTEAVGV